ncbi:MAG: 50S ribosomal protein L29 [bacterium]|nr:50S ribosomal protein L29 [bacterium]
MKKNDIKQLMTISKAELKTKLDETLKDLKLKRNEIMQGKVKNVHLVKESRKDVARILTAMQRMDK